MNNGMGWNILSGMYDVAATLKIVQWNIPGKARVSNDPQNKIYQLSSTFCLRNVCKRSDETFLLAIASTRMLKLENKQKCNSHTCWQWDFVKMMLQQNFTPTVAWQQSRQSTVGDEVEQVFLLRRRWSFNCPPLTICPKVDTTLLITVKLLLLLQPNNSNILQMRHH